MTEHQHHHSCPVHGCPVHGHSHQSCSCGTECTGQGCTCSDHHGCCHHHEGEFSSQLLDMADQAWMEVLKDKIKEHVEATSGKNLEELAKIVADANHERWKSKMAKEKGVKDFKQKVADFFSK